MTATERTMKNLKPFWQRVTVIESPVDEAQRASGLIVPLNVGDYGEDAPHRGVVVGIHTSMEAWMGADTIEVGTVIYYSHGVRIHDVIVVYAEDIIAYEDGDEIGSHPSHNVTR